MQLDVPFPFRFNMAGTGTVRQKFRVKARSGYCISRKYKENSGGADAVFYLLGVPGADVDSLDSHIADDSKDTEKFPTVARGHIVGAVPIPTDFKEADGAGVQEGETRKTEDDLELVMVTTAAADYDVEIIWTRSADA